MGTLNVAFGGTLTSTLWYLPNTIGYQDRLLGQSEAPYYRSTPAPAGDLTPAEGDADGGFSGPLFDGSVEAGTEVGGSRFDVVEVWNSVKNVLATSDEEEHLVLAGFVHADVAVGLESDDASEVTLVGAKRGNVVTGAGDDAVTIEIASNGPGWLNQFRIDSGGGDDVVTLAGLPEAVLNDDPTFAQWTAGNGAMDTSGRWTSSWIAAGDGDDIVQGHGSRDRIDGQAGDDDLRGGGGNDILDGGAGDDALYGDAGNDVLLGDGSRPPVESEAPENHYDGRPARGDDRLVGGTGDDVLSGGRGRDTFVFDAGSGRDTITDFKKSQDTIVLSGHDPSSVHLAANDGGTVIEMSDSDSITLIGVNIHSFDLDHLAFV